MTTTSDALVLGGDQLKIEQRLWLEEHSFETQLADVMGLSVGIPFSAVGNYGQLETELFEILADYGTGTLEEKLQSFEAEHLPKRDSNYAQTLGRYGSKDGYLSPDLAEALLSYGSSETKALAAYQKAREEIGVSVAGSDPELILADLEGLRERLTFVHHLYGKVDIGPNPDVFDPQVYSVQVALSELGHLQARDITGHFGEETSWALDNIGAQSYSINSNTLAYLMEQILLKDQSTLAGALHNLPANVNGDPVLADPGVFSYQVFVVQVALSKLGALGKGDITGSFAQDGPTATALASLQLNPELIDAFTVRDLMDKIETTPKTPMVATRNTGTNISPELFSAYMQAHGSQNPDMPIAQSTLGRGLAQSGGMSLFGNLRIPGLENVRGIPYSEQFAAQASQYASQLETLVQRFGYARDLTGFADLPLGGTQYYDYRHKGWAAQAGEDAIVSIPRRGNDDKTIRYALTDNIHDGMATNGFLEIEFVRPNK
ncbi:MAG: hypothetical protein HQ596_03530 [Candidatus Saganbacteria bacterium]|nr:hypothetical protein [Candidatus Saganbacteria bacterium]